MIRFLNVAMITGGFRPKIHDLANVWMGVSVENQEYTFHIIDWVIVEGESGHGVRSMAEAWALDIRDQCVAAGAPLFFKRWGGVNKNRQDGCLRDGRGMRCRFG